MFNQSMSAVQLRALQDQLLSLNHNQSQNAPNDNANPSSEETKAHESHKTKIKPEILIKGYTRLNYSNQKDGKYVLPSIIDIILYYYPKMKGYKFTWKVLENKDELITSIDSDPFDIGLPN